MLLISAGREFHSTGPAIEKEQSPPGDLVT